VNNQSIVRRERDFGLRLRAIRQSRGLSQQMLAEAAGVNRKTVNRIECGRFSPNLNTLMRLAYALSLKVQNLVRGI
jgi:transcriptional regulator with XRE-family HTH domain